MKRTMAFGVITLVALAALPAQADLFNFNYNILQSTYNGSTFSATVKNGRSYGEVTSFDVPVGELATFNNTWGAGAKDFVISMDIANIDNPFGTADGSGSFAVTDVTGDQITGDLAGTWLHTRVPTFAGALSNVVFDNASGDGKFDGDSGFVTMSFSSPQPWEGMLIELTTSGLWFTSTWSGVEGGGAIANVVPLPGAVLLGMLGLAAAGRKLRQMV